MKHTIPSIILGAAALLVTACKNDTAKEQTEATTTNEIITITHTLGTVEVPKNPQRIAVLDYASLEALEYLDLKVVAMPKANLPKHLAAYKNDASIIDIGTVKEIDFEKLNELSFQERIWAHHYKIFSLKELDDLVDNCIKYILKEIEKTPMLNYLRLLQRFIPRLIILII